MWIIKRADGQYYQGIPDITDDGCLVAYTPEPKHAKTFSEDEKENIILFSNEEWESAVALDNDRAAE